VSGKEGGRLYSKKEGCAPGGTFFLKLKPGRLMRLKVVWAGQGHGNASIGKAGPTGGEPVELQTNTTEEGSEPLRTGGAKKVGGKERKREGGKKVMQLGGASPS